jgi:hypothetical protein
MSAEEFGAFRANCKVPYVKQQRVRPARTDAAPAFTFSETARWPVSLAGLQRPRVGESWLRGPPAAIEPMSWIDTAFRV